MVVVVVVPMRRNFQLFTRAWEEIYHNSSSQTWITEMCTRISFSRIDFVEKHISQFKKNTHTHTQYHMKITISNWSFLFFCLIFQWTRRLYQTDDLSAILWSFCVRLYQTWRTKNDQTYGGFIGQSALESVWNNWLSYTLQNDSIPCMETETNDWTASKSVSVCKIFMRKKTSLSLVNRLFLLSVCAGGLMDFQHFMWIAMVSLWDI